MIVVRSTPDRQEQKIYPQAIAIKQTSRANYEVPNYYQDFTRGLQAIAFTQGITLKQAAVDLGLLTPAQFDAWVIPEQMIALIAE